MGLIGTFVCGACRYRSRPILLGAGGEPYELALGLCGSCREILTFDPDFTFCRVCGHSIAGLVQDEDGAVACPRCGGAAELREE